MSSGAVACRALQVASHTDAAPAKGMVVLPALVAEEDLEPGAYDPEKAFQDAWKLLAQVHLELVVMEKGMKRMERVPMTSCV